MLMRNLTRLLCVSALLMTVAFAESLHETRKKAESSTALEQWLLGGSYANGKGVPKDSAEAVKWYRKAAEQGFAMAQSDLGVMYKNGTGVAKNSAEAIKWYRKSAAQNDAGGQFNLGLMYAKGEGVPKDLIQAHMWLNLAGATEDEIYATFAKTYLSKIEEEMTSEQIGEATTLAREMFEREMNERLAVAKARAEKVAADKAAVAERVAATKVEAEKRRPDRYPVATYQSRAVYPYESRAAGRTGEVSVSCTIDVRGKVINARAVRSSSKEFEAAAVAAVEKWKFRPAMKNGKAIEFDMEVPIVFTLSEEN
jgi:TonB family protein